mgnify:CR=1 FL=1
MARDLTPGPAGDITRALARATLAWRWDDLPQAVRHEARRCLVNFFACALAAASCAVVPGDGGV